MLANPGAYWTTQDVARHLFKSVSTLRRRLVAEGISFQKLLDDVRLNNALAAIQSTLKPVSVVARDNGYMCPSRFTARFQQRFGNCTHSRFFCQSCKSKACSACGMKSTEQWIAEQQHVLPDCEWQHITFTMPHLLWPFFNDNWSLLNDLLHPGHAEVGTPGGY